MDLTRIGDRMMAVQSMADLSHAERTVLTCIAYHDGPEGAYPSVSTLCAEAGGMSRKQMFDTLAAMESKGRIKRTRRRNRPSLIRVQYDDSEVRVYGTSETVQKCGFRGPEVQETRTCIEVNRKEQRMAINEKIGWCRDCGHDHSGGPACLVCGGASAPFIVAPHECRNGTLTMPLGIVVSGLDTPEARALFLSDAGQEQLQAAFGHVLESQPLH